MITISKQQLIDLDACSAGLERFIAATNNTDEAVAVSRIVGRVEQGDLRWLIRQIPDQLIGITATRKSLVKFSIGCAELVVHLSRSDSSKKSIEAARVWLNNPSEENRKAAAAAAAAAADADDADADADAAAYAAAAVAYADDAAYAAAAAAAAYAAAAADDEIKEKIDVLFVELFNQQEK